MYEMMTGHIPFKDSDEETLLQSILNDDVICPPWLSTEAESILTGVHIYIYIYKLIC